MVGVADQLAWFEGFAILLAVGVVAFTMAFFDWRREM